MGKKILFIGLHRPGRSPSQRFRFEQYIDALQEEGYTCLQAYLLNQQQDKTFYAAGKYIQKMLIVIKAIGTLIKHSFFKKYDIIFVQREAFMLGTSYFERKMARKAKLIFDFDDAIWKRQAGEIRSHNKTFYFLKNPDKTKNIIKAAHMVFAGNQYLANFARSFNTNIKIVPTTIDTNRYQPIIKKKSNRVCIGWSGSFSTLIYFENMLEVLQKLKKQYQNKLYFKVIGDKNFINKELEIQGIPWQETTEIDDLTEIDIGIMPLPDDAWTKGKCGLKGLQYMALGIPAILSPVGVNQEIIQNGKNGFLASSKSEWLQKLSTLIESPDLRRQLGQEGRKTVEKYFSVKATKKLYIDHFNDLIN